MPIYEYQCHQCSHKFELIRRMSEADKNTPCPHCESHHTSRMVSKVNAFSAAGAETRAISGASGAGCGCGSCSSSSCATCHH